MGSLCSKATSHGAEALISSVVAAGVWPGRSGLLKEPPLKVVAKVVLLKSDVVKVSPGARFHLLLHRGYDNASKLPIPDLTALRYGYGQYWSLTKDLQLVRGLSTLRSNLERCPSSRSDHRRAASHLAGRAQKRLAQAVIFME